MNLLKKLSQGAAVAAILLVAFWVMGSATQNGQLVGTAKLDSLSCDGLNGTSNSLCYRVHEIEKHLHNYESWFGIHGAPSGTDWADDTLNPFQCITGNGVYGADANDEAEVMGTDDTPHLAGMVKYDVHRILIVGASSTTQYKIRLVWGTGTMADAIIAGQTSEFMVKEDPALFGGSGQPVDILMPRIDSGTKLWIQCKNATDNATIDFFVGVHEYAG